MRAYFNENEQLVVEAENALEAMALQHLKKRGGETIIHAAVMPEQDLRTLAHINKVETDKLNFRLEQAERANGNLNRILKHNNEVIKDKISIIENLDITIADKDKAIRELTDRLLDRKGKHPKPMVVTEQHTGDKYKRRWRVVCGSSLFDIDKLKEIPELLDKHPEDPECEVTGREIKAGPEGYYEVEILYSRKESINGFVDHVHRLRANYKTRWGIWPNVLTIGDDYYEEYRRLDRLSFDFKKDTPDKYSGMRVDRLVFGETQVSYDGSKQ